MPQKENPIEVYEGPVYIVVFVNLAAGDLTDNKAIIYMGDDEEEATDAYLATDPVPDSFVGFYNLSRTSRWKSLDGDSDVLLEYMEVNHVHQN